MEKLSSLITDFYIRKNYVPEDKREIYCFGFQLIIADIVNFSIVMLLGLVLGAWLQSVVFLITLCGLRRYSGGFHAKTFWLCRLSMLITFFCVIVVSRLLSETVGYHLGIFGAVNVLAVAASALLAPVKHPNKHLNEEQKKSNKRKAVITSSALSVLSLLLIQVSRAEGITISITLAAVVILMIIGIAVQKGGRSDVSVA